MENDETTVENNDCDFVDIGGAEQSLSHENRSWKFCNSVSLPSAKIVFFRQICYNFILLSLSISKLFFYNLIFDETFGFNTIHYSWLHVTQSQLLIMNKIISRKDCLFMSVSGPPGSSKIDLIFQMLLKSTFYPSYNKIFYFYLFINPNTVPLFLTTILILNL